ncbi:hypothetical protein Pmani_003985 [Petrolisthes manimaculis]|uniref:Uncharacterized protein n=1 Tax=Petrolisthes manimaculis TaxID=1843537 RepID=A0AAE1QF68_9EUCA|nr:hypothetical protein Pmani_003985 [Petrolisthes manimaculis]
MNGSLGEWEWTEGKRPNEDVKKEGEYIHGKYTVHIKRETARQSIVEIWEIVPEEKEKEGDGTSSPRPLPGLECLPMSLTHSHSIKEYTPTIPLLHQ